MMELNLINFAGNRQDQAECRSQPFLGFEFNEPAMGFDNFFGNGQPEPGTCFACGWLNTESMKFAEKQMLLFGRDARPFIADAEFNHIPILMQI